MKGDLNEVQRSALVYLIGRERQDQDLRDIQTFKQRMLAVNPDKHREIDQMFAAQDGELAPRLSDNELDEAQPLSANEIETALDALKELGFAVQDVD